MSAALIERRWWPPDKDEAGQHPRKVPPAPKQKAPTTEQPDNSTRSGAFASPVAVTFFSDWQASTKREEKISFADLVGIINNTTAGEKSQLPWLKLATFGAVATKKKCLRHNANVRAISGVELDYDGEMIGFDEAVETAEKAGLRAIIYTSPSHTPDKPRWRVLAPASGDLPPAERARLVDRVNGLYGGVFAPESWSLSTSYYFGSVDNNPDHRVTLVNGQPVDQLVDLDTVAIGKPLPISSPPDKPARAAHAAGPRLVQPRGSADGVSRNITSFYIAMRRAPSCSSHAELLEVGLKINRAFSPPLELPEVAKIIRQAWGYQVAGRNWIGQAAMTIRTTAAADILAAHPRAAILYPVLKRMHGARDARGETFAVAADAMAKAQIIPGWESQHYRRARAVLVELGFLVIVHRGGHRVGNAHQFSFQKGGPPMGPRIVISNAHRDVDLMRVVDALKAGLSIRRAGETLGLDKSKVLRLKHRAEASGLFGEAALGVSDQPVEVSHFGVTNVRNTLEVEGETLSEAGRALDVRREAAFEERKAEGSLPPPEDQQLSTKTAASVAVANDPAPAAGCMLNFPQPGGGHRLCSKPVGRDGIFCIEHGGGAGSQSWIVPNAARARRRALEN